MPSAVEQTSLHLSGQGRLVIPAVMRRALDLHAGDALMARLEGGGLLLEKRDTIRRRVKARFSGLAGGSLADELIAERRADAERERNEGAAA